MIIIDNIYHCASLLNISIEMLQRDFNYKCSGGEKKMNELLQLMLVKPKICLIDEIDSGLDIQKIEIAVNTMRRLCKDDNVSFIVVSHNTSFLQQLEPICIYTIDSGILISDDKRIVL